MGWKLPSLYSKMSPRVGSLLFPKVIALLFLSLVTVDGTWGWVFHVLMPNFFCLIKVTFFSFVSLTICSFLITSPKDLVLALVLATYAVATSLDIQLNLKTPLPWIEPSLTRDWDDGSKYQTAQLCAEWVDSHSCNIISLYLLLLRPKILKPSRKDLLYAVREKLNCLVDVNYASGGNHGWRATYCTYR